jgi:hypothetical protein
VPANGADQSHEVGDSSFDGCGVDERSRLESVLCPVTADSEYDGDRTVEVDARPRFFPPWLTLRCGRARHHPTAKTWARIQKVNDCERSDSVPLRVGEGRLGGVLEQAARFIALPAGDC